MTTQEILQQCWTEENVVKLPPYQLDRKQYLEVKKALELIGGKWKGGKVSGFVFQEDPEDLLAQIASGEQRNLKKEFQFFATPSALADRIVELANIRETDSVLEPSAGKGAIVQAVNRVCPDMVVSCYELMGINCFALQKIPTVRLVGNDFLQADTSVKYDKVLANPPFAKNQDIDHIRRMYEVCKDGGTIVTVASKHWEYSNFKKETAFRDWLADVGADVEQIPADTFKESGTRVAANLIVIRK